MPYRLSTYMHKQKDSDGGKLVMGPVWDYKLLVWQRTLLRHRRRPG